MEFTEAGAAIHNELVRQHGHRRASEIFNTIIDNKIPGSEEWVASNTSHINNPKSKIIKSNSGNMSNGNSSGY